LKKPTEPHHLQRAETEKPEKPENPERTDAYTGRTCKVHTERPQMEIEPGTCLEILSMKITNRIGDEGQH